MRTDAIRPQIARAKDQTHAVSFSRDSVIGSVWTAVSRLTGFGQSVAVALVLGATYLGNTYQAINALPNIVYYQLLAGSLFASILVPPLVASRDRGDGSATETLARGFYGTLLLVAAAFCVILIISGPLVLRLLTLGVPGQATGALQRRVGLILFVMFIPQIAFYLTAGTGAAVMNAHGRYALAAAAPALENLGMISTLALAAVLFGTAVGLARVTMPELLLLGCGTTASVALHATAQWFGARSCGVRLIPTAGWRDKEVKRVLRRVPPMLGYTVLAASQTVVVLIVANRLAGGLVAFQLALNLFFLPIAVVAWPIARSMLPHLTRLRSEPDRGAFWAELCQAARLATFVAAPMAVGYVVLASPIAQAIAVGRLRTGGGGPMVAMSLRALGAGVIGETWFILGTYAFYARENVWIPLRAMLVRAATVIVCASIALSTRRPIVLLILGLALSGGSAIGSVHLWKRLRSSSGLTLPLAALSRIGATALFMAVPTGATAWALSRSIGENETGQIVVVTVATAVGASAYLVVQKILRAPEFSLLKLGAANFRQDGR
jgi:putative peptidoglycan lipid II flippase